MLTSDSVDICIVGGGMVGGTLANVLSRLGYSICMIESQTFAPDSTPELIDERSVVLSYSSKVLLELMGLWDGIESKLAPIRHIHVSERGRFGTTRLHARDENVDALGYVVRNSCFMKNLYAKLHERDGDLQLHTNATLESIKQEADHVEYAVRGQNGESWNGQAKLLIAADGTLSSVRNMISIGTTSNDYNQAAVIANVRCENNHNNTAYERFTEQGPLALLPLDERLMAMVYTIDLGQMSDTCSWSDEKMLKALQQRFGFRLGRFETIGKRLAYPLCLIQSTQQSLGRVILLGNAARTLHPVSGQGFNLALRDSALLLESLSLNGRLSDPGQVDSLKQFCQQRQMDQKSVVGFTDTLVKVFRGKAPAFSHLRAAGLSGLDSLPPLKHFLAQQSMGMTTRLPNLTNLNVSS